VEFDEDWATGAAQPPAEDEGAGDQGAVVEAAGGGDGAKAAAEPVASE
jgi:hypothetical protein